MAERHLGPENVSPIGRDGELAIVDRFVTGGDAGTCLVLAGDAGIGKTTLWQSGIRSAEKNGVQVLWTRASEDEAAMLFAGLADLMDDLDADLLRQIPPPQAHALEVALRRIGPDLAPPEPFSIVSGFLSVVRKLASSGPTLIAVDDVQWLDTSSNDCLLFLARRLKGLDIRFLFSRRGQRPTDLELALEYSGVEQLQIGALSMGAISRLVSDRLDLTLPRRVVRQLYETSQGNCLFALELARRFREDGIPGAGSELPLPSLAEDLYVARVRGLEAPVRQALLAVALSSGLTREQLASAVNPMAVEEVLQAGMLALDRGRLRPAHPMYAAAARSDSSAVERREVHLTLAGVLEDEVLRARHIALATIAADAEVAGVVAEAAVLALERGAFREAETLAAHALRLTPREAPERAERLLKLVECHLQAGDYPAADALRDHVTSLPQRRQRAMGHLLLGEAGEGHTALEHLDLAMQEAPDDARITASALASKAGILAISLVERLPEAAELARQAELHAEASGEAFRALNVHAWTLILRGQPLDEVAALPKARTLSRSIAVTSIDRVAGVRCSFRGELEEANAYLSDLLELTKTTFDDTGRVAFSIQMGEFALRAGDVERAANYLDELDQWIDVPILKTKRARLYALSAAIRGQPVETREWAQPVLEAPEEAAQVWDRLEAKRALGVVALFEGDAAGAAQNLDDVWQHCVRHGVDDPGAFPVAGDLVEAFVDSGQAAAAEEVTGRLERLSAAQNHPWGAATSRRSRAMIEAASGDTAHAIEGLLTAASEYAALGLEFERARCLLYVSRTQRHSNRRGAARDALTEASTTFDRLGCEGWADRARSELQRISGRKAVGASDLTPSEQRVAELAVNGLSNKEIAKALVVSVYTVQTHLSRAYAKLGVRSRGQLANRLGLDR